MSKEKILVVDDSATQLIMYKMALSKAGYRVITAKNGVEGVNFVETENPDLIVSDIIMPELNGYQFCRLVKDDPSRAHIPIILLTSLGQQQDRFWGIEAGANSFVTKSVDNSALLGEVERLLKSASRPQTVDYTEREENGYEISTDGGGEESVKTKINRILERLLYESTVSNRMRDLSRFAYSRTEMIKRFFDLFAQIIEYHASSVTLFSKEQVQITFDVQKSVSKEFLESAKALILEKDFNPEKVRLGLVKEIVADAVGEDKITDQESMDVHSSLLIPLKDDENVIGSIGVFTQDSLAYNKDIVKIVQLIAREMVLTIKYIWKLEEIERIKSNFTSTIVNDLRSPILANQSFVDALYNEYVDPVTEDQKEILSNIIANNKKLLTFVNDILDISRIDRGKMQVVPQLMGVRSVMDDAVKNMRILAEQKEIEISVALEDPFLEGFFDGDKIVQVFNNLMSNAIKFTPNGGAVEIGCRMANEDTLQFWVRDSGIGIPEEEQPIIFEKYKKSGGVFSSDDHAGGGGVGLGLAICKSIVEAHDGKIWVESKVGEGSVFFFTTRTSEAS